MEMTPSVPFVLRTAFAVASITAALESSAADPEPIELMFSHRPPFMALSPEGTLIGETATPAIQAFNRAGISYKVREASPARRLKEIQENSTRVCSIGFYKVPERELFGKFSSPVSQDSPMVGVATDTFLANQEPSLDTLLGRTDIRVLIKKSINYGSYLQQKLDAMKAVGIETAAEYPQILEMLQGGRGDMMFMPLEEAIYYTNTQLVPKQGFRILRFAKMPLGEKRYIFCSNSVPDDVISRLNSAIRANEITRLDPLKITPMK